MPIEGLQAEVVAQASSGGENPTIAAQRRNEPPVRNGHEARYTPAGHARVPLGRVHSRPSRECPSNVVAHIRRAHHADSTES